MGDGEDGGVAGGDPGHVARGAPHTELGCAVGSCRGPGCRSRRAGVLGGRQPGLGDRASARAAAGEDADPRVGQSPRGRGAQRTERPLGGAAAGARLLNPDRYS